MRDPVHELVVLIAAAVVGAALFERLRLPAVAGFLVVGAVVGPRGPLPLVEDPERVRLFAEFGVAFLLFEIGLELPIETLRRMWRTVVASGLLQVSLTVAGVTALGVAAGVEFETALVLGMLVSMSSTALVMRLLAQRGEVGAPHGRLSLGILLFQDLCLVPFLLSIPILAGEVPRDPSPLARALGQALAALVVLYAVSRFVLPRVLERVARLRSPDLFSVFAFLLAVGMAVVAEEVGLTLAVGAFIAGLVLNASPYDHQLFAEVAPLRGVLLGVFFTAVGMLLDPAHALAAWSAVLLYVGLVVILKSLVVVGVLAGMLREALRPSLQSAITLAQTGEFSFVLAAAAAAAGVLGDFYLEVFVAGSVLTLVATPFLIRAAPDVARRLAGSAERLGLVPAARELPQLLGDHVIIAGFGMAGRTLARVLKASEIRYVAVDMNPHSVDEARKFGEPVVYGDSTRPAILEALGIRRARLLSIVLSDPEATRRCIAVARTLNPNVHVIARTRYVKEIDELFAKGASQVVAEEFESTIDLFSKVLRAFGIPQPGIAKFAEELREEGYELMRGPAALPIDPWLAELLEDVAAEWIEVPPEAPEARTIRELGVRARTGANILAVRRGGVTTPNPAPDFSIEPGDSLLVLAEGDELGRLRELLAGQEG